MKAWVVLTAAGSGSRLGAEVPKALVETGGQSLLELALRRIVASDLVQGVVVTCPPGHQAGFEAITTQIVGDDKTGIVVPGGTSRQSSVYSALKTIGELHRGETPEDLPVLVHDAARCLTPTELFDSVINAVLGRAEAVIPVLPVVDTIKVIDEQTGLVTGTPNRSTLRTVQTPQGFKWGPLYRAHVLEAARGESEAGAATDDAALVESQGVSVFTVPGDPMAFKVTVLEDLDQLRRVLNNTK